MRAIRFDDFSFSAWITGENIHCIFIPSAVSRFPDVNKIRISFFCSLYFNSMWNCEKKKKFIHFFLTLGSEGRRCKHGFFSQLGTAQRLVVFRASVTFGFCVDLCLHLYRKQYMWKYSNVESVGGASILKWMYRQHKDSIFVIFDLWHFCMTEGQHHWYQLILISL